MTFEHSENAQASEISAHHHHGQDPFREEITPWIQPKSSISVGPGEVDAKTVLTAKDDSSSPNAIIELASHHGHFPYPNPSGQFEPPHSKVDVSPPGHVVPTIELLNSRADDKTGMIGKAAELSIVDPALQNQIEQKAIASALPEIQLVSYHHHGGGDPYLYPPTPVFHRPQSSISVSPPGKVLSV